MQRIMKMMIAISLMLVGCLSLSCHGFQQPQSYLRRLHDNEDEAATAMTNPVALSPAFASSSQQRELQQTDCPVCKKGILTLNTRGPIRDALKKAKRLLAKSKAFGSLKDALLSENKSNVNKVVSVDDSVIPALNAAESHFTAIATTVQTIKLDPSSSTSPTNETLTLLESVATLSASVLHDINNIVIQNQDTATAGLVVSAVGSVLAVFEDINLRVMSIVVDYMTAFSGDDDTTINVSTITKLRTLLSSGSVFEDTIEYLTINEDTSGLIPVLTTATTNLSTLSTPLSAFTTKADAAIIASSNGGAGGGVVQGNTINQILSLISSIISTILSLIVQIITSIINLIVGIINAVLGLIIGIIQAIIALIVGILQSILNIFTIRSTTKSGGKDDVLLDMILPMVQTPLLVGAPILLLQTLLCTKDDRCSKFFRTSSLQCQQEALICQNNALSEALPTV